MALDGEIEQPPDEEWPFEAEALFADALLEQASLRLADGAGGEDQARLDVAEAEKKIHEVLHRAHGEHPGRVIWLLLAAEAARFRLDLDEASGDEPVRYLTEAVALSRHDDPLLAETMLALGRELFRSDAPDDLDQAIHRLRDAVSLFTDKDPQRLREVSYLQATLGGDPDQELNGAGQLAELHYTRWEDQRNAADLDAAIAHYETLVRVDPEDLNAQLWLGLALDDRYLRDERDADRDSAIERLSLALAKSDDLAPVGLSCAVLGELTLDRAAERESRPDLDLGITALMQARRSLPVGDARYGAVRERLYGGLSLRYSFEPDVRDVAEMIEVAEELRAVSEGDDYAMACAFLGIALGDRMRRAADPQAELDRLIEILAEAFSLLPEDSGRYLLVLRELGIATGSRGQFTGDPHDLVEGVRLLTRALELMPPDDADLPEVMGVLALTTTAGTQLGALPVTALDEVVTAVEPLLAQVMDPGRRATLHSLIGIALTGRSLGSTDGVDLDRALHHLVEADRLATDEEQRLHALVNVAGALQTRYFLRGELRDIEVAIDYLERAAQYLDGPGRGSLGWSVERPSVDAALTLGRAVLAARRGDQVELEAAVTRMERAVSALPEGHPMRVKARGDLGVVRMLRYTQLPDSQERDLAVGDLAAAGDAMSAQHMGQAMQRVRVGAMQLVTALQPYDRDGLDSAVAQVRAGLNSTTRSDERTRTLALLGTAFHQRYRNDHDGGDLDEAIVQFELARTELGDRPGHTLAVNIQLMPARAYRDRATGGRPNTRAVGRDDAQRALSLGVSALREHARGVLVQTGAEYALTAAGDAAVDALEICAWALADGEIAAAVEALELGRGLVLYAATSVSGMAVRLRAMGETALAQEWEDTAPQTDSDGAPVPDDLRARTVRALTRPGSAGAELLVPPSIDDLAAGLRTAGMDALVYLVSGTAEVPGQAILVTASGQASALSLPLLFAQNGDRLAGYVAAHRELWQDGGEELFETWERRLEDLCGWAGRAVMRPLLRHAAGWGLGREPRLVLVPVGELGRIPWHAAGMRSGDRRSYAIQHMVVSYAAGARQFVESVNRTRLPYGTDPVIVVNPTEDLRAAGQEAVAFRRCYPAATVFGAPVEGGRSGDGTSQEILARLPGPDGPGASVLHLACHGWLTEGSPARSHLVLAGGEELSIASILTQAEARPADTPGGLIMPIACVSGLTDAAYDESLSVATAFLAAGAATTVGTLWEVDDRTAAMMMYVFHRHLTVDGDSSVDALRRAQLWMLDPLRPRVPGMPIELTMTADGEEPAYLSAWAGFAHRGR
jgi:tetratricopeptide (TPR) repeat protein